MASYEQHLILKHVDANNMSEEQADHYLQYFLETIETEQQANLTDIPKAQQQEYITEATWKLITERDEAHGQCRATEDKGAQQENSKGRKAR